MSDELSAFRTFVAEQFKNVFGRLKAQDDAQKQQNDNMSAMASAAERSANSHARVVTLIEDAFKIAKDDALMKHDIKKLQDAQSETDFQVERILLHIKLKKATTEG